MDHNLHVCQWNFINERLPLSDSHDAIDLCIVVGLIDGR